MKHRLVARCLVLHGPVPNLWYIVSKFLYHYNLSIGPGDQFSDYTNNKYTYQFRIAICLPVMAESPVRKYKQFI
jgi:hypothetical protein